MSDQSIDSRSGEFSRRVFLKGAGLTAFGLALGIGTGGKGRIYHDRSWQPQAAIDVTDPKFGAKGDGVTNDRAALQAAIDEAIQKGVPLHLPKPAAFYKIDLDAEHDRLAINGDLVIFGDGRADTLLRFSIPQPDSSKTYYGFYIHNGSEFKITDLRLEEDALPVEFEFQGLFFESGSEDHECLIERVDVAGFTNVVVSSSSGSGDSKGELFLTIRDCDFRPGLNFCVAVWTVEGGHKRLHLYDSYFHDNVESHLIYCHPHNSIHAENCRFDGASAWAFHIQGSAVGGNPDYQRFIGCWFGPRNGRGLITQDRETVVTRVDVLNCMFECRPGVQIRSDILVDGCYFTSPVESETSAPCLSAYSNSPWAAVIRNCVFAPRANTLPQADFRLENIDVTIDNCQFYNQGSGAMLNLGVGPTNTYKVTNCLFYNRMDNASQSISIEVDNGQATIDGCRFIGRATADRGVIMCSVREVNPSPDSFVRVDNCTFQEISGGSLFYVLGTPATSWSNKIVGQNNRILNYYSGKPLMVVDSGEAVYGRLAPVLGQATLPLSAGTTMIVNSNYDTYQVIGTFDVANLHWWSEDGLSDPLFTGEITLKAGMPFVLVSGGNIQLTERAGGMSLAAGESIRLLYTSDQAIWTVVA